MSMLTNQDFSDCIFIWLHSKSGHSNYMFYDTLPIGAPIGSKLILQKGIYEVVEVMSRKKAVEEGYIPNDEFYEETLCFLCEWCENIDFDQWTRHIKLNNLL